MDKKEAYYKYIESKITIAKRSGFDISRDDLHSILFPHQIDVAEWALRRGKALIALSFGLGKTILQQQIAIEVVRKTGGKFLVVCPLGVKSQFQLEDGPLMGVEWLYVTSDAEIEAADTPYLITNYERVRDGGIDPRIHNITGVSLDEGSVLRSMDSKTTNTFIEVFEDTPYKFVCTATPSPNNYKELIYYANFLGVADTGLSLAQPLDAKILTPDGWENMGDIKEGDCVIAADGQPVRVLGVYPQGKKDIYRITFTDDSQTECTEEHLWLTRTQYERNNEKRYCENHGLENDGTRYATVKTTKEIAGSLTSITGSHNHQIPLVKPVQLTPREVEIDPWLMGYLLGDGSLRETSIQFSTIDEWIADKVSNIVSEYDLTAKKIEHIRKDGRPSYDYAISGGVNGGRGWGSNRVLSAMKNYGLIGKRSWEKFIPDDYLFNTVEVRLGVLRGLMDADGYISTKGNHMALVTTSEYLAKNVKFICQSLGGTANINKYESGQRAKHAGYDIISRRPQYRVAVRLPNEFPPFELPRKLDIVKPREKYPPVRYIKSVERTGRREAQCIAVDHPDRLYVTDDFILTHNTKWFKRDSQKAGNLTLHPHHEKNFWLWVASWGVFLYRPSDLGYSDKGYDLPKLNVHWHKVSVDHTRAWGQVDNRGQAKLFLDAATGTSAAAAEKRETLYDRLDKAVEILAEHPDRHWLVWHDLEREREAIEKAVPGAVTVYGAQSIEEKEKHIIDFSHGRIKILASKPSITGSGCNFQRHCHSMIFLGVSYFFQDFIQAIHRVWRFMQVNEVDVHIIYAESEEEIVRTLQRKWKQHDKLTEKMQDIVKKYGLNNAALKNDIQRQIGIERYEEKGEFFTAVNNDSVLEMFDMESDSVGLIHTSIPFGNQYSYTISFEDFGHNTTNKEFWEQMDFLIPELLRVLKPGRIAAIHTKDRVLYSHQTKSQFMEISPFSDECVMAFRKHGFMYAGRRTIVTDVVKENAQTYRLGWTECTKDASKMGCGSPEYLLLFRKPPSDKVNARADEPITKDKESYSRARWQVDAHSLWRSNGNRPLSPEEYAALHPKDSSFMWSTEQVMGQPYDHERHVAICESMDKTGRLSASYMMLPPKVTHDEGDAVWDDVIYMRTLNSNQSRDREESHICPLPFDIVERTLRLYSNPDDIVLDPFAGLFTVPMLAIKMGRRAIGIELSDLYYEFGLKYCKEAEQNRMMPTLFDYLEQIQASNELEKVV